MIDLNFSLKKTKAWFDCIFQQNPWQNCEHELIWFLTCAFQCHCGSGKEDGNAKAAQENVFIFKWTRLCCKSECNLKRLNFLNVASFFLTWHLLLISHHKEMLLCWWSVFGVCSLSMWQWKRVNNLMKKQASSQPVIEDTWLKTDSMMLFLPRLLSLCPFLHIIALSEHHWNMLFCSWSPMDTSLAWKSLESAKKSAKSQADRKQILSGVGVWNMLMPTCTLKQVINWAVLFFIGHNMAHVFPLVCWNKHALQTSKESTEAETERVDCGSMNQVSSVAPAFIGNIKVTNTFCPMMCACCPAPAIPQHDAVPSPFQWLFTTDPNCKQLQVLVLLLTVQSQKVHVVHECVLESDVFHTFS